MPVFLLRFAPICTISPRFGSVFLNLDDSCEHRSRVFSSRLALSRRSRRISSSSVVRGGSTHLRLPVKMEGKKKSTAGFVSGDGDAVPKWAQRTVTLPSYKRGCHLVTPTILKDVEADLAKFKCGLAHFFLQHTSASLTINENYDSDVLDDVETWLTGTVPEGRKAPWKHTIEGPDDMPAHIKSSVFGCALSIPITDGRLNLGTWQGIWLCEHRDHASARKVVITMTGV